MSSRRFEQLLEHWSGLGARAQQDRARTHLSRLLEAVGLSHWRPEPGTRPRDSLLLGVASWSKLDLRLLDRLAEAPSPPDAPVATFDLQELSDPATFRAVFPEIEDPPAHTPMLIELRDGCVRGVLSGADARQRLSVLFQWPRIASIDDEPSQASPGPAAPTVDREIVTRVRGLLSTTSWTATSRAQWRIASDTIELSDPTARRDQSSASVA